MQIFQQLAGYSLGQADMVRRAMSKKKAKDIAKEREAFLHGDSERGIVGCVANGIPEETAEAIYNEIYDFANYAFNKAHAVSYAVVAYQTAWFKCHYTKEYMAALLTSVLDNSDKVAEYINECRDCGITLLPPDVNRSRDSFTVEEEGIRFGLVAIKNIGRSFIQALLQERESGGQFSSFQDFCERMLDADMNKRAVENLIRSGAFDSLGAKRSQLIQVYERVLDSISSSRRQNLEGQMDFFGMSGNPQHVEIHLPNIEEYTPAELMTMERETTGLYLSGHPMRAYREAAQRAGAVSIAAIQRDFAREDGPERFQDGQRVTIAGIVTSSKTKTTKNHTLMAYVMVEDETASMELLCFSKTLQNCGSYLKENLPVVVRGKLSVRDEKAPQILCDTAYPLTEGAEGIPAGLYGEKIVSGETVYLRIGSMEDSRFRHLQLVLEMFPGQTPLKIRLLDTGKLVGTTCLLHSSLLRELEEVFGKENVVVK